MASIGCAQLLHRRRRRRGPPAGRVDAFISIEDLSGVQASDALHATITSADGRRYTTTDGGLNWTPQQ